MVTNNALFMSKFDQTSEDDRITTHSLRRDILRNLLMWESVIITDSQANNSKEFEELITNKRGLLLETECGMDKLLEQGDIEIAIRCKNGEKQTLYSLREDHKNNYKNLPYIPEANYSKFLDKHTSSKIYYDLDDVADLFRQKLERDLRQYVPLHDKWSREFHKELLAYVQESPQVNFSDLLNKLNIFTEEKKISIDERKAYYNMIYSDYSSNIPDSLGLYFETLKDDIPVSAEMGDECLSNQIEKFCEKGIIIRDSWALSSEIFDYLPTEAFIEVRNEIKPKISENRLKKFLNSQINNKRDLEDCFDFWNDYVKNLEIALNNKLCMTRDELNALKMKQYVLKTQFIKDGAMSILSFIISQKYPLLGTGMGAALSIKGMVDIVSAFVISKRKAQEIEYRENQIKTYLDYKKPVIAKYPKRL